MPVGRRIIGHGEALNISGGAGRKIRKGAPTIPSWNQLVEWLRELDLLRRGEAA
jgi:hypothetical protein